MKRFAVAMLAAWTCHAQQFPRSPEDLELELERDLRGLFVRTPLPAGAGPLPSAAPVVELPTPARPTGESISVQSLRHKVPKDARNSFARAQKLWHQRDYKGAAAELEQTVRHDPEFAGAYNALGVQYAQLERFDEGKAALERALALDPNFSNAYYNLAVLEFQLGDEAGAEQNVRRHLQMASEDPYGHWLLGCLLYLGDSTRAEGLRQIQYAARRIKAAKQFLAELPRGR